MIRELSEHEIDALHYELLVKDIVGAAEKLPAFPDIAWKVISLVNSMAPVKQIEDTVRYDQAITAKLLRLGNSVYYGRQYEVRSLKDAILLIGNKRLIQVVIAACATRYFGKGCSRDECDLWEHSVITALMSEIVARRLNCKGILTLYTASLLHDIGNTVLNLYSRIYLHSSLRETTGEGDVVRCERRALGIDHQELGGIIARNWKFPSDITAAIEHHHNPEKAGQFVEITSMVYLADLLAASFQKKNEKQRNKGINVESDPIFKKYSVTRKMIDDFQIELETSTEGVRQALGVK
ncbi:MAG: HDOD domain-containing protein [Syntrophobacteraceae bacterium]|jgi:putative nucleotidyltransferase with HDIG domain